VATHDLDLADGMFDRAVFLREGRMLDVIDRPSALRSTYRDVMNRPAADVGAGLTRLDG
jgi:ABC-type multidrug transport system ATPase subunit